MKITATAVSYNVDDVAASAAFLTEHFGFREEMAADGFASLAHDDAPNVIFHRRGLEVLPEDFRYQEVSGVILAFVVEDLAAEEERLAAAGVKITLPRQEEEWGERLFQVKDPNGVIVQLVEWATPS